MPGTDTDHIELLTREQLDSQFPPAPCGHPRLVHPGCHPRAGVRVAYNRGMLALFCASCGGPVFAVVVGRRTIN